MENAIVIAQVLSPVYLVLGLSIFINQNFYKKLFVEIPKNSLLSYSLGILKFIGGVIILNLYSSRATNRGLIITIIGRFVVLGAGIYLIYPPMVNSIVRPFSKNGIARLGILSFFLGLALLYCGYLHA